MGAPEGDDWGLGGGHDSHDGNDELWLISYSDMMTLLFGFFVLMYALSKSDPSTQEKVKQQLARSFAGSYVSPDEKISKEIKELAAKAKDLPALGQIEITQPEDGLEITFRSNLLFPSGGAELLPDISKTLKVLVGIITKNVQEAEIMVAGHTDNIPISTKQFPSNWELSAARAATVVKEFQINGYPSHLLVALGYGDSRPAYPNETSAGIPLRDNQGKNRRVVIKVIAPGVVKQPSPLPSKATPQPTTSVNEETL